MVNKSKTLLSKEKNPNFAVKILVKMSCKYNVEVVFFFFAHQRQTIKIVDMTKLMWY